VEVRQRQITDAEKTMVFIFLLLLIKGFGLGVFKLENSSWLRYL
jgi:hypothetical protein